MRQVLWVNFSNLIHFRSEGSLSQHIKLKHRDSALAGDIKSEHNAGVTGSIGSNDVGQAANSEQMQDAHAQSSNRSDGNY